MEKSKAKENKEREKKPQFHRSQKPIIYNAIFHK